VSERRRALIVAGLDPSGGAGLTLDAFVFAALGYAPASVVTLVTAQNSASFAAARAVDADLIASQLAAVLAEGRFACAKVGAIGSLEAAREVAQRLGGAGVPVVVDPVLRSSSDGDVTGGAGASAIDALAACATVVTPNAHEAALLASQLTSLSADAAASPPAAGTALAAAWDATVVVTGVPVDGETAAAADVLCAPGAPPRPRAHALVPGVGDVRGTGCMFSSSLAAFLGIGLDTEEALARAQATVSWLLGHAAQIGTGRMQLDVAALIKPPQLP
jgi:hydroxymethylpyrimidine kinase/phosphomethylpyrimidine kinase